MGTPATYTADATGFVHIDAWDAVSDDIDLTEYAVHNDFYVIDDFDGSTQITIVNDEGVEDWDHSTGCNIQFDPTKTGTYLCASTPGYRWRIRTCGADTFFRVVVGSGAGTTLTLNENSIDLSTVNLLDAEPNLYEKYYWVGWRSRRNAELEADAQERHQH